MVTKQPEMRKAVSEPTEVWAIISDGSVLGAFNDRETAEKHARYVTSLSPLKPPCTYCRYVVPATSAGQSEALDPFDTLLARHVNGTTFCFEYEGYGAPVSVWAMDSSVDGEGATVVEAARDLCMKLGLPVAASAPVAGQSEAGWIDLLVDQLQRAAEECGTGEYDHGKRFAFQAALAMLFKLAPPKPSEAAMTPLTIEMARVIRTWRVDLGCTWGRVDELAEKVWGFRMGPGELCEHAARALGEDPGEEPWN